MPFCRARVTGNERKDVIEKSGDNVLPAVLGHHVVKTRISAVGHAAALVKALDDAGLDLAQHADVLREVCDVAGFLRIGEELGDCFGQDEVVFLDFNDFSGSHGAEPFANVAFVEARGSGELRARAAASAAKGLKETGAMSEEIIKHNAPWLRISR